MTPLIFVDFPPFVFSLSIHYFSFSSLSLSLSPSHSHLYSNDTCLGVLAPQKKYKGQSTVVVRPISAEEVSKILNYCNANGIGIVPQGGNTSLVGGSVSRDPSEVVLTLECMNEIHEFDETCGIVKCDAALVTFTGRRTNDLGSKKVQRECPRFSQAG